MTIYVAEILGRAIAAFNADNQRQASQQINDQAFQSDLSELELEGRSLWDGVTEIVCREATAQEIQHVELRRAGLRDTGNADDHWLMFLVPRNYRDDDETDMDWHDDDDNDGE